MPLTQGPAYPDGGGPVTLLITLASLAQSRADTPFVPDVTGQFDALTERPDALGFYRGASPDPTACKHYQGLVRVDAPDGTPYFYVSRSGNIATLDYLPDAQACGEIIGSDDPGNLLVVRMGSRDQNGERLRSNRIASGSETVDTAPPSEDTTVAHFTFDGSGDWPSYGHPGGMQAVGDVVALALETPYDAALPETAVLFFDVSDREAPAVLGTFDPGPGVAAGLVGFTAIPGGRYLLLLTGGVNDTLRFYESVATREDGSTDLRDPALAWVPYDVWTETDDEADLGSEWPTETGAAHQTLHFVREGSVDGVLYLAAARGKAVFGEDLLDLYRVDFVDGEVKLAFVSSSHKNAHPSLDPSVISPGNNTASFAAASAFHTSPTGELLFYATEHDNDGPSESVKMGEWRHIDMVRPGSPTLLPSADLDGPYVVDEGTDLVMTGAGTPATTRAWLQLWAGTEFSDRYLVMDHADRSKDDFDDFKDLEGSNLDIHLGFDNEPSSLRLFAPTGCTIRVNDDDSGDGNFPGTYTRTFPGTGEVVAEPFLSEVQNDSESGSIDEELTSAQFFVDCDDYYAAPVTIGWDLDDDGVFETVGGSAVLDGLTTDGPEVVEVPVVATQSGDSGVTSASVTVLNVAPTVEGVVLTDLLGQQVGVDVPFVLAELPVGLSATFTDPGRRDWQAAVVDYGDGTVVDDGALTTFSDATGTGVGTLSDTHTWDVAGDVWVTVIVEDDDGGSGEASTPVSVVTAEDALLAVVAEIDVRLGSSPPAAVAAALRKARSAIAGNHPQSNNGALSKLAQGNTQAALVKLRQALASLEDAEAAGAVGLESWTNIVVLVITQLEA